MPEWNRRTVRRASRAEAGRLRHATSTHQAVLGNATVYFTHTVPTSKSINLGKATKRLLDSDLAVSAAWPSDDAVRVPPRMARLEREVELVAQGTEWADSGQRLRALLSIVLAHPVAAFRVLRMLAKNRGGSAPEPVDGTVAVRRAEQALFRAQGVTRLEHDIDASLFWSEREDLDDYVRLFLRPTSHTIRIGEKEGSSTLEPRLLMHREGVLQLTVGVSLPEGCTPGDVIDAAYPDSPLFQSSRVPEPYALPKTKWASGEWADELDAGVRIRVIEHEDPVSIRDWLEMAVDRILRGIGSAEGDSWYTYPMIMAQTGECCAAWTENHAQDIVCLATRTRERPGERLTLDSGPDLSISTSCQAHANEASALVLYLRPWSSGIRDLEHTMLYERIALTYMRLRSLERRLSDFRTGKREVLRSYRQVLSIEKEVRGAYFRAGTAREISRHVLTALGAFEMLGVVRNGASMLGERASTRAAVRAGRATNRIALVALLVAMIAAIPSIPSILQLIHEQRAAYPDASVWALIQTLATSPLRLSALVLGAVALYLVAAAVVLAYRVVRYLLGLQKRGYASRIGGYELSIVDAADTDSGPDIHSAVQNSAPDILE